VIPDEDPILRIVGRLTVLSPDRRRTERVRARCRVTLQRRSPVKPRRLAPALIAGMCVLYLSALVHEVFLLRALL
jgi:hypothetical protein